ncbi:hypothetical protein PV682_23835 [Streptomyces niveiscabiei]|uniref:hypothetical protein n=1 Tax=Streptomyces niveiscabiei TaxID=164115 RepID=UPI0029B6B378|nr:hypothetical protein [Streptomyces niveiscabiei]MDX3384471.1 hypothetical protein [Streptomyces niveiscabiei]
MNVFETTKKRRAGRLLRGELRTAEALLREAAEREEARDQEVRELRQRLQQAEEREFEQLVENEQLYDALQSANSKVRFLKRQLEEAGLRTPPPNPPHRPATFTELLDRLPEFPHLRFTGNPKRTKDLDAHAIPNWVSVAWDALEALDEYAAHGTGVDFRHWCDNLPETCEHPFPAGKVTMRESETVANHHDWRRQRTFPVPESVARGGRLFMQSHLRIGSGNTVSPRLYFHDDTANSGLVYVGYLGAHLDNTHT